MPSSFLGVSLKSWFLITPFSLAEFNRAISEKLTILNGRKFKKLDSTRKKLYETIEKPALKPLPPGPYEYAEWKKARVNIDYHIETDRHYYSVPYQLVRKQVDVRLTSCSVEVLFKNRRVASHRRSYHQAGFTTLREHMPKSHQRYLGWTPSRIIRWASRNGPKTQDLVTHIKVLILDDLGLAPMTAPERRDLLEVIENRHGLASTIVATQLPIENWHENIRDPTIADAILDRLIHNAYKINLKVILCEKYIHP